MRVGNVGKQRKLRERVKRLFANVSATLSTLSGVYTRGALEFSRLPDSATLAPLRLVERA